MPHKIPINIDEDLSADVYGAPLIKKAKQYIHKGYCLSEKCCSYYLTVFYLNKPSYRQKKRRNRTLKMELSKADYRLKCIDCEETLFWIKRAAHGKKTNK